MITPGAELASKLQALYPNPYTPGEWVEVPFPIQDRKWQMLKTRGKGRNSHCNYMHLRRPIDLVVRTPEGEELSRTPNGTFLHLIIKLNDKSATWQYA